MTKNNGKILAKNKQSQARTIKALKISHGFFNIAIFLMCVSKLHIHPNIFNQKISSIRYWNYGDWSLYWSCSCHCSRLICNLLSSIWWCHIQRRKKITKQILKNNNKFLTTFDACNFVRYFWLFLIKSYRCECLSWNIFRRKLFHKICEIAYLLT